MHTPPPWKFEAGHVLSEDDTIIAEVAFADDFKPSKKAGTDLEAEHEANGFLLAAAPELLAALKALVGCLEDSPNPLPDGPYLKVARMAIAKAGGPQQ